MVYDEIKRCKAGLLRMRCNYNDGNTLFRDWYIMERNDARLRLSSVG
jgi:hypothetical protein